MKLSSKIQMFEEFNSTEKDTETAIDSKGAVTTTPTTTILDDVDHILGDLETLSKQIDEECKILLKDFEKASISILESEENIEMINEDFMKEIMKQVNSMKAYGKLVALYPKMKKNILKAELKKTSELEEFKATSADKTSKYTDELKAAYKEKIAAISASDAPAIKKSQKKEALRQQRDAAIEKGAETVNNKLKSAEAKLTKQLDNKIRDLNAKLTDLQNNNKIEAELLSKQWASEKIKTDDEVEFEKIDQTLEIKNKWAADNPDQVEKNNKFAAEQTKKMKDESTARQQEKAEELAAIEAQFAEEAASGTEEEKEAKKKIVDWFKAGNAYATYLGGVDFGVEESLVNEEEDTKLPDAVIDKIKELRKAYSDANAAVSISTFKKAGSSETDAEEQFKTFKEMVNSAVEEYSDQVSSIEGIDDSEPTPEPDPEPTSEPDPDPEPAEDTLTDDQTQRIQDEETQRDQRQQDLDAEKAKPEAERSQQRIQGLEAGIAQNNADIEAIRNEEPNESVSTSDFDQSITESYVFKSGSVADRFRRLI